MNYELMVLVNPTAEADAVLARVEKSIKDANASTIKIERLGKKLLAYPIGKQKEGEYLIFNFQAQTEAISAISQRLRLEQEAILRYLIIKTKVPKITKPKSGGLQKASAKKPVVTVKTVTPKAKQQKTKTKVTKVTAGKVKRQKIKV